MNCSDMKNKDWDKRFPGRCYFYPGRDCPGWEPGSPCGRIGDTIPDMPAHAKDILDEVAGMLNDHHLRERGES